MIDADDLAKRRAQLADALTMQRRTVQETVAALRTAELNVARLEGALLLLDELTAPAVDAPQNGTGEPEAKGRAHVDDAGRE